MNVQTKIACMLGGITLLFLCSVLGIRYYLIYNNLNLFESEATNKIDYFDQVLQSQQTSLEMFTYDAAVNREVIAFIEEHSLPVLQKTMEDAMPSFGVDTVWLYNQDNQLLHHQCRLSHPAGTAPCVLDTDTLQRMFQRGSQYRQFFKKMPIGIMEIRTAPAALHTYDQPDNQSSGIIIAGRLWSSEYINTLAGKSRAELRLVPMQDFTQLEPDYHPATGRLHFGRVLLDENRRPLSVLSVSYETPLIQAFNRSSNIQVALLLVFGLVIFSLLAWSFAAWIISPLKKISTSLRTADPAHVEGITGRNNEFGTIALLIINFFRQKDALVAEINERREVEEALRQSQDRFRSLVETTSDLIWEMDADLKLTYVSPRSIEMFGINPDELTGKNVREILLPGNQPSGADTPADILKRHEAFNSLVACVRHKDGRTLFIEASAMPIHEDNKRFLGYRGITRDITKRRQIEEQLRQAQTMQAIGALAGGIAHDFNNILAAILGYTEIAIRQLTDPAETRRHLQSILKATDRAINLVRQILTFSRKSDQEHKPVMPKIVIKEALKLLRASLPSTIEIRQNIRSDSVVMADPTQIHQVIMNLCTNAGYAMQEHGGILEVSLIDVDLDAESAEQFPGLSPGKHIKLFIADTGSGIQPEIIERIFEPFFTTKPRGKGTGLGLSVVHGIVESFGGAISMSSKPGIGTSFAIYLPSIQAKIPVDTVTPEPLPGGTKSILFVDDEPMLADIGKKALEALGYQVTACTNSLEALEMFKKNPAAFDAVITDYTMPKLNGLDLAKTIISIRPRIPVILSTGCTDDIKHKAHSIGINEFFLKPLKIRDLAETLRRTFGEQPA
jgi:PAS domain S-box-containing protein